MLQKTGNVLSTKQPGPSLEPKQSRLPGAATPGPWICFYFAKSFILIGCGSGFLSQCKRLFAMDTCARTSLLAIAFHRSIGAGTPTRRDASTCHLGLLLIRFACPPRRSLPTNDISPTSPPPPFSPSFLVSPCSPLSRGPPYSAPTPWRLDSTSAAQPRSIHIVQRDPLRLVRGCGETI